MLTTEQNEQLTRTGRGTLMGDLFRRYWIPALHGWEIAEPDSPPVRVHREAFSASALAGVIANASHLAGSFTVRIQAFDRGAWFITANLGIGLSL